MAESTQRQYALRERAVAAGWPDDRIHVIDCDLGKSGSSAESRDGFQKLVSEVALTKAGIVMGLEVSRLARNSADWHRLLELCGQDPNSLFLMRTEFTTRPDLTIDCCSGSKGP